MEEAGILKDLLGVFEYYAARNNLSTNPQREYLPRQGFVRLCKDAGLFDKNLSRPMVETIFLDHVVAAVKKAEADDVRKSRESMVHEIERANLPKQPQVMTFARFINALGSCANLKYGKGKGLVRRMDDPVICLMKCVQEHILPNCTSRLAALKSEAELFYSDEMSALLEVYDEPLQALFVAYCTIDARSCPRWAAATAQEGGHGYGMSFFELWELSKDFHLACVREGIQPQISRNQLVYMFLCANRVGLNKDNNLEIVSYGEFKEILCRMAVQFVPVQDREDMTPQMLVTALQQVLARMDASPGMMKITLHYGGTHTGKLRLVPDSRRLPIKVEDDEECSQPFPPPSYMNEGVRALHDEAYPQDGSAPDYVNSNLVMQSGSPPWRGYEGDDFDEDKAYIGSPAGFSASPSQCDPEPVELSSKPLVNSMVPENETTAETLD